MKKWISTHIYPLARIDEAYALFEEKRDRIIKVVVECCYNQQ